MSFPPKRIRKSFGEWDAALASDQSPNCENSMQALPGTNPKFFHPELEDCETELPRSGERMSACTSRAGSLTVEAALLLPLFLLAVYLFWTFFPALQAQVRLQFAMDEVTENLAKQSVLYAALSENGELDSSELQGEEWGEELLTSLTNTAWTSYAKAEVVSMVGETALSHFPIENGKSGLSFSGSSWDPEGDIDLAVRYRLTFPAGFGQSLTLEVKQHSLRKCWTGQDSDTGEKGAETAGEEIVYVTPTGTVYHRSPDCYHLKITVRSVSFSQVEEERNQSGAKYYPCERCAASLSGVSAVYITSEGNRYHVSSDCPGLRRTVSAVPLSEVGDLRACSSCG